MERKRDGYECKQHDDSIDGLDEACMEEVSMLADAGHGEDFSNSRRTTLTKHENSS